MSQEQPEAYWMGGRLALIHRSPADPQAPSITESWLRPGQGPARFVHRYCEFTYYVIEGEITFSVGDESTTVLAGRLLHVEANVEHTYVVGQDGARVLMISTPGHVWVDYVRALGAPATSLSLPPTSFVPLPMEVVDRMARAAGFRFVGERMAGASREGLSSEA